MIDQEIRDLITQTAIILAKEFPTRLETRQIARDAVPFAVRNLDSKPPSGDTLKLGAGGEAAFGPGGSSSGEIVFSNRVWVGGTKVTIPARTTNYLKVYFDKTVAPEWVASIPDVMPDDAEIFDVTQTAGDLHLPGNMV